MNNCSANGNTRLALTLIEIVDCNLNISNSKFLNQIKYFKGPAIINAVRSQIYIKNTNISQNCALDGLIWTSNNSVLYIQNSMFSSNGLFLLTSGVLILKHNSALFLSNSTCSKNRAVFGPCVLAYNNVTIVAKYSMFYTNHAVIGGAIYWKNSVYLGQKDIKHMKSEHLKGRCDKNVKHHEKNDQLQENKPKIAFDKCIFVNNIVFKGAVLHVKGPSVEVLMKDCFLHSNLGFREGAIIIQGQHPSSTKLHIEECNFHGFSFADAILFISRTQIDIHNCNILDSAFALMSIADYSVVNITHFTVKLSTTFASYISIQNFVTFYMADSQMISHYFSIFPNAFFLYALSGIHYSLFHFWQPKLDND